MDGEFVSRMQADLSSRETANSRKIKIQAAAGPNIPARIDSCSHWSAHAF
jgi:hypothetical protein